MHYSSSLLLVGAVAPIAYASPLLHPRFNLPFRRSVGDIRSWNGTLERRSWNNTLSSRPSNTTNSTISSRAADPIILHQTLNETHPYFAFLSKRSSKNIPSTRTKANSTVTAKEPIPLVTPPPPKFHPEIFDPSIYTIKHKERKESAPLSTAVVRHSEEKRQIIYGGTGYPPPPPHYGSPQYLPSPPGYNFPPFSGAGGQHAPPSPPTSFGPGPELDEPLASEDEDERARQEGPEASQMPPGHPVPEGSPGPGVDPQVQEAPEEILPLVGNVRRDMMNIKQLQQRKKSIHSAEDVEEAKAIVREMTILEHRELFGKRDLAESSAIENTESKEDAKNVKSAEFEQDIRNNDIDAEPEAIKTTETKADTEKKENGPYGNGPYNSGDPYNYGPYNGGGPSAIPMVTMDMATVVVVTRRNKN